MGAKLSKHKRPKKNYQGGTHTLRNSEPRRHTQSKVVKEKATSKGKYFKPKKEEQGREAVHVHPKPYTTDAYESKVDDVYSTLQGYDVTSPDESMQPPSITTTTQPNTETYLPPSPYTSAPKTPAPKPPSTTSSASIEPAQPVATSSTRKKQEPLVVDGQRFYRPGEAGHPAYRATSKEWVRRYGMGQNALVKRKPKAHAITTVVANASATNSVEPTTSGSPKIPAPGLGARNQGVTESTKTLQVPLDNVLGAETHNRVFRPSDVVLDKEEGDESVSQKSRKMEYYRPGDPRHQAARPTTEEFRRKHSALNSLSQLQGELIRYD